MASSAPRHSVDDVRRYYDRHTRGFLAFGTGGGVGAIHRAVWAPGVASRDDAFRFVDGRVVAVLAQTLGESSPGAAGPIVGHVVDLGCGVGASLCRVAEHMPIRGTGLTLSPLQVQLARDRARSLRLDDRVSVLEASFLDIPPSVPMADVAYAIESFAHTPDPVRFFEACARLIRPGGALVLCDDFLEPAAPGNRAAARARERFARGWRVNTLLPATDVTRLAERAGFSLENSLDLSTYLEPLSLRDRVLDAAMGWLPLGATPLGPVLGGAALKRCLACGWTSYRLLTFRR